MTFDELADLVGKTDICKFTQMLANFGIQFNINSTEEGWKERFSNVEFVVEICSKHACFANSIWLFDGNGKFFDCGA